MGNQKKPAPLRQSRTVNVCSVCGENSYSLAGIHPQCAVRAADKVRIERIKSASLDQRKDAEPVKSPLTRYQKICSRCRKVLHVRRKTCDCGYEFSSEATR